MISATDEQWYTGLALVGMLSSPLMFNKSPTYAAETAVAIGRAVVLELKKVGESETAEESS